MNLLLKHLFLYKHIACSWYFSPVVKIENFEKLEELGDRLPMIYVGGLRADDMANRLKYAGRSLDRIKVIKNDDQLLEEIDKADVDVFIMPTYSAMLSFREKISKRYNLKSYWEN